MLLSLLCALVPQASGAAYYFVDTGTRGMARGGAYIAGNEDLSAQYYNPAALIRLERPQAYINWSMVDQSVEFTRVDLNENGGVAHKYETVNNIGKPMQIPAFGVSHKFGLDDFVFALGMYPPFAPDMEYPADGAQRYTLIDSLVWQIYAGPSVAWQPVDGITIGMGLVWTLVRAEEKLAINVCNPTWDEEVWDDSKYADASCTRGKRKNTDLVIDLDMMDPMKFTANVGLLIEPTDWMAVGLSVLPPLKVSGKGSIRADFEDQHWLVNKEISGTQYLTDTHAQDDDITVSLNMPLIVRSGIAVDLMEGLEVELASVYERWQVTEEIRVDDVLLNLAVNQELQESTGQDAEPVAIEGPVILPANYSDTISLRLGTEYDANEWLSVRTGAYWEQGAIPPKTKGVALVDGDKWGYGLGASYHHKNRFSFDLALSQSFIAEAEIRDSTLTQLQVPVDSTGFATGDTEAPISQGGVVGNGTFAAQLTMASAGLTVYFGP